MEEKESKVDHAGEENAVPTDKANVGLYQADKVKNERKELRK